MDHPQHAGLKDLLATAELKAPLDAMETMDLKVTRALPDPTAVTEPPDVLARLAFPV